MPDPDLDPQSRVLQQLSRELAEIRARADQQRRWAAWWREEVRVTCEEARRLVAQSRELVAASRRHRQERADAEEEDGAPQR
jgi:hypothetical protein